MVVRSTQFVVRRKRTQRVSSPFLASHYELRTAYYELFLVLAHFFKKISCIIREDGYDSLHKTALPLAVLIKRGSSPPAAAFFCAAGDSQFFLIFLRFPDNSSRHLRLKGRSVNKDFLQPAWQVRGNCHAVLFFRQGTGELTIDDLQLTIERPGNGEDRQLARSYNRQSSIVNRQFFR